MASLAKRLMDSFRPIEQEPQDMNYSNANTKEERDLLNDIINFQTIAESGSRSDIEEDWDNEYLMYMGDQWDTTFAQRQKSSKMIRPNSVDNFIFQAITNQHSAITASTPETVIEGTEENDNEVAKRLTYACKFNDYKIKFSFKWKRMVLQYLKHGILIGGVFWNNDLIGGKGPGKWIGDVDIPYISKDELYFDPAIIDLENDLQDCEFINWKIRKKLSYFKDKWENGKYVTIESNTDEDVDEGSDPNMADLYISFHRGKPKFIPDEWKQQFEVKAQEAELEGLPYKAQDYRDMAEGKIDGVHCAYTTSSVFLEYIPYMYDDGLYPFVVRYMYVDERSQYPFGEIKQVITPQITHNMADEIELGAMAKQGLGNYFIQKGAMSEPQIESYLKNNAKGGMLHIVNDINGIREEVVRNIPQSISNYREHKQRMVETITQNTAIQQGMSPGANVPYATVKELGARTDTRTKGKVEILEDFLIEINKLRINRFAQFYTEERYFRIEGPNKKPITGSISSGDMKKTWQRDIAFDEIGNPIPQMEEYIPDFDVKVKVMDEKPTDRNYYTNIAMQGVGKTMTIDDFWYTLEEGKFPPKDIILEHLQNNSIAMQIAASLDKLPPEAKQAFIQQQQQLLQQIMMRVQQTQMMQQSQQQPNPMHGGYPA